MRKIKQKRILMVVPLLMTPVINFAWSGYINLCNKTNEPQSYIFNNNGSDTGAFNHMDGKGQNDHFDLSPGDCNQIHTYTSGQAWIDGYLQNPGTINIKDPNDENQYITYQAKYVGDKTSEANIHFWYFHLLSGHKYISDQSDIPYRNMNDSPVPEIDITTPWPGNNMNDIKDLP